MALFVDGPACTIDDLTDQDTGLLDVALQPRTASQAQRPVDGGTGGKDRMPG